MPFDIFSLEGVAKGLRQSQLDKRKKREEEESYNRSLQAQKDLLTFKDDLSQKAEKREQDDLERRITKADSLFGSQYGIGKTIEPTPSTIQSEEERALKIPEFATPEDVVLAQPAKEYVERKDLDIKRFSKDIMVNKGKIKDLEGQVALNLNRAKFMGKGSAQEKSYLDKAKEATNMIKDLEKQNTQYFEKISKRQDDKYDVYEDARKAADKKEKPLKMSPQTIRQDIQLKMLKPAFEGMEKAFEELGNYPLVPDRLEGLGKKAINYFTGAIPKVKNVETRIKISGQGLAKSLEERVSDFDRKFFLSLMPSIYDTKAERQEKYAAMNDYVEQFAAAKEEVFGKSEVTKPKSNNEVLTGLGLDPNRYEIVEE